MPIQILILVVSGFLLALSFFLTFIYGRKTGAEKERSRWKKAYLDDIAEELAKEIAIKLPLHAHRLNHGNTEHHPTKNDGIIVKASLASRKGRLAEIVEEEWGKTYPGKDIHSQDAEEVERFIRTTFRILRPATKGSK